MKLPFAAMLIAWVSWRIGRESCRDTSSASSAPSSISASSISTSARQMTP